MENLYFMMNPHPTSRPSGENVDQDVLTSKLEDLEIPGFEVAFDPHEADELGAFREEALTVEAAMEATIDLDWEVHDV